MSSPARRGRGDRLRRREFITLLGGAAAWPLVARAQQTKLPTIGLLGGATPSAQVQWTAAFVQRLRELGWVEGQTVTIEYRWVEGRFERSPAIIAEFVRLKVDVIVTHATPNTGRQAGDIGGSYRVSLCGRPGRQ
jgi:hypothetical protein